MSKFVIGILSFICPLGFVIGISKDEVKKKACPQMIENISEVFSR